MIRLVRRWIAPALLVLAVSTIGSFAGAADKGAIAGRGTAPFEVWVDAADDDAEESLLRWMNEERAREGREPLARRAALDELARLKAWDMARHGYFDHVSERLGTVFDMLREAGIDFKWAGENIARSPSAGAAHEAFMESPGHRSNILSAGYTDVGIGVVRAGGKLYVCQIFMKPRAHAVS